MGVILHLGYHVKEIHNDHVIYQIDLGEAPPVIWAAGVQASGLGKLLSTALGAVPVDRAGASASIPIARSERGKTYL